MNMRVGSSRHFTVYAALKLTSDSLKDDYP